MPVNKPRKTSRCPITPEAPFYRNVKALINDLDGQEAIYIPVESHPTAKVSECFWNVDKLVKDHGGTPVYGWCIWDWPGYYARAEHHCIWRMPDGRLVDPTPKEEGDQRILFVPDEKATPEVEGQRVRVSVWRAEPHSADANHLVEISKEFELVRYMYHRTDDSSEKASLMNRYRRLDAEIDRTIDKMTTL
ncbi:hypothetical protein [Acetobacter pasteurianus]|uniref:Uncharacterized protein n=1 Tax=Acetobacter pasteurianus NBRC 3188 TaxID=1226663 RepID=A0A401WVL9_ACEPA|nr:hypothetical protein [Acetobacter pasteurianus]GCD53371.1 hypothetical protein NBRC3188_2068 [Acetobacter pasteurianus NBRC 3188]